MSNLHRRLTHGIRFLVTSLLLMQAFIYPFQTVQAEKLQSISAGEANFYTKQIQIPFGYDFAGVPEDAYPALMGAIENRPVELLPAGTYFVVGVYEEYENWGIGTLAAAVNETPPMWGSAIHFILYQSDQWSAALEGTSDYEEMLGHLPDILDQQLNPPGRVESSSALETVLFPWDKSQQWKYTQSWHNDYGVYGTNALDFAPYNVSTSNMWVLAASSGNFSQWCSDGYQAFVKITSGSSVFAYGHLDNTSYKQQALSGSIPQGKKLGLAYSGSQGAGYYNDSANWPWPSCTPGTTSCRYYQYKTTCGAGTGAHVHWVVPSKTILVDGWQANTNGIWTQGNLTKSVGSLFSSTNPPSTSVPAVPSGVTATDGTLKDYVLVSWNAVTGATSYEVWRNTSNTTSGSTKMAAVTGASYNDTGATALTPYFYWVKACNAGGCSGYSSANAGYRGQDGVVMIDRPALTPAYSNDICGTVTGKPDNWYQIAGFGDAKAYLTLNTNQASQATNSGIWQPNLPVTGTYKVEAFIPNHTAVSWPCPVKTVSYDTSNARYTVHHVGGPTTVSKDQSPLSNAWLNLGNFTFNSGTTGKVQLVDLNSETNISRTISFSAMRFTLVSVSPPGTFPKSSPANGAIHQSTDMSISWSSSSGVTSYEYCYDTTNDNLCDSDWVSNGTDLSTTLSSLGAGTTYYWQVRAKNAGGITYADGNVWWSFSTLADPPASFSKTSPSNGATNLPTTLELNWGVSSGASSYEYCYDDTNDNGCSTWINNGNSTTALLSNLNQDTLYYWQVRASNSSGTTYSDVGNTPFWSFRTQANTGWNDNINFAKVASIPYNDSISTGNATTAGNDPVFSCVSGQKYNTVWYQISPSSSSEITIDTNGSDYDTVLAVWAGSPEALASVACNDDYEGSQSKIQLLVNKGTNYFVEVASYEQGGGNLALNISAGDKIPPVVNFISRAGDATTNAGSVDFTLTFSEPVSNVDTGDFIITSTGISGAGISKITGLGKTYTVTAITGTGNGLLRLDIPLSATVSDLAGNSLAGLPYTNGEVYNIVKTSTFSDVPLNHMFWMYIETFSNAGITTGCSENPKAFCPDAYVTRAQMAIFLLRAKYGSTHVPPPAVGSFSDVPANSWIAPWIEQMATEGITSGCTTSSYCPNNPVTRAQMAIFLLRAKYGSSYTPPPANGKFNDVPANSWTAPWIEQLATEGITSGCTASSYCPNNPVTRGQMAVFLVRTFNLP